MRETQRWLGATSFVLLAAVAGADVLVTRDGERIETKGPWKVQGRQVVFTDARGTLASLRLDDVDLEASEAATRRVLEPPTAADQGEAETPRPKSILSLTNADVGRGRPPGEAQRGATEQAFSTAEEIRVTLGSVAHGYALDVRVNGRTIPNFSGGQSEAVQLFHTGHPSKARMIASYDERNVPQGERTDLHLFCLREGKNQLYVRYEVVDSESASPLKIYMNAVHYTSEIFEFDKTERMSGILSAEFEVYRRMPRTHKTQTLR